MQFYVEKLHITGNAHHVEVNTSILDIDGDKVEEGRQYCNFIITYDEYVKLNLKVGDCIKISVSKV